MTEYTLMNQEELKQFLIDEITHGRDLDNNKAFKNAIKECTDDELLYQIAERSPQSKIFSYGDIASAGIRSNEYRYAVISSTIRGRKALVHDLAINRELDEMLAIRILLTDSYDENKRESMYVINSEALLMLAFLKSMSYRVTAKERLSEIGSKYPGRYFAIGMEEKENILRQWYGEACDHAERLIEMDKEIDEKISPSIDIDSSLLICFLAACHPDQAKRIEYARMITSEYLSAYVGVLTDDVHVKRILSRKIHSEDLICSLPYCDSFGMESLLIKDTYEKRVEFCLEVLRNTDSEETRELLMKRMEKAEIEIPEELQRAK